MQNLKRGFLIAVEGIDGSGKSTLVPKVVEQLEAQHIPTVLTQEPGKTGLGAKLRDILQKQEVPVCAKAQFLMYAANRAQHFEEIVIPALKNKRVVISDRIADSSLVYQGFGRGLDIDTLKMINTWAMSGFVPDLTLYVHITPEVALERLGKRTATGVSDEQWKWAENRAFIEKAYAGYQTLYASRTDVVTLDGTLPPDKLTTQAVNAITTYLKKAQ